MRLSLTLALLCAAAAYPEDIRWLSPPHERLEVNGLHWYKENGGELFRLPVRLKDSFRPAVWTLAQSPSGGRIRFRSNTQTLAIRLQYPSPPNMTNMHAFGQTGVDLYVDGVYHSTAIAPKDAAPEKTQEHFYFRPAEREAKDHELVLYLPLYKPVTVLGIGIGADATLAPPTPFASRAPVVFYGTSITQGGCASRPGMSYQAILGRMLNIDFINLGFSGNGLGEPELARAVASIDAACFVIDFAQNNRTLENLQKAYSPFLDTVRKARPDTPILAITPIHSSREAWGVSHLEDMRTHIREVVSSRIAAGDRKIRIIEGPSLIGPSRLDGLVDGSHPNDLGFQWMAEGIAPALAEQLRK